MTALPAEQFNITGLQVRSIGQGDWEAFTEDFSKHYTTDSRWLGGRFTAWSLDKYDGFGLLVSKRSGYADNETGAWFFGKRK